MTGIEITGVLLAAGISKRYDPTGLHLKQLALLDGQSSLQRVSAQNLLAAVDELLVVHGPRSSLSYPDIADMPARQFSCLRASEGIGRSLQSALAGSNPCLGWLVALADMPRISTATYSRLRAALIGGSLLARPCYQEQPGHPVALSVALRDELMALAPDKGAGLLFKIHQTQACLIETDDIGCIMDADTPQALSDLKQADPLRYRTPTDMQP